MLKGIWEGIKAGLGLIGWFIIFLAIFLFISSIVNS